jgi:hypothetical protein
MKLKLLLCIVPLFLSCINEGRKLNTKDIILQGNREAPLGWVYLTIYEDSTFVFTLTGLRDVTPFPGKAKIQNDTIYFTYSDSIPKAGTVALLKPNYVSYINGEYPDSIGLTMNKISNPEEK